MKKSVFGIVIVLLLTNISLSVFVFQSVKALDGTIYVRADGSIDPLTASISTVDNVTYTFTDDIHDSIVVERNNIIIDGSGYALQGTGSGTGIDLTNRENVTIQSTKVKSFNQGISLSYSENCLIISNEITLNDRGVDLSVSNYIGMRGNNIATNNFGIWLAYSDYNHIHENNVTSNIQDGMYISFSYNNSINENNVTNNYWSINFHDSHFNSIQRNDVSNNTYGFHVASSTDNSISGNRIANNQYGVWIAHSSNTRIIGNNIENNYEGIFILYSASTFNRIIGNNVTNNQRGIKIESFSNYNTIIGNNITSNTQGIWISDSFENTIYHNNFVNNDAHAYNNNAINIWDNGFPSGGNYWSDYNGVDADEDGIGDTSYVIDEDNQDDYPFTASLMPPIYIFDAGTWEWIQYNVYVTSNSTVSDFSFNPESALVQFTVEGETGTRGFCNVTIPKNLLTTEGNWTILVDDAEVMPAVNEDTTSTYIYFTYNHSTKTVEIIGTNAIPEFSSALILAVIFAVLFVAVTLFRKIQLPK